MRNWCVTYCNTSRLVKIPRTVDKTNTNTVMGATSFMLMLYGQIRTLEVWQHVGSCTHSFCPEFSHIFLLLKTLDSQKNKAVIYLVQEKGWWLWFSQLPVITAGTRQRWTRWGILNPMTGCQKVGG